MPLAPGNLQLQGECLQMKACVTGATGFIGGPLVKRLLAGGASVRVLARPSQRADQLETTGAQVVRGDLRDAAAISRAVEKADVVFHIAAKVNPPGGKSDFFETNVGGTESVLKASLERGAGKVIYLSSISVYGLVREGEQIDEEVGFDPMPQSRDFYAQSKIAADELASSFSQKTGLPVAIVRPGLIYGPGRPLPLGLLGFSVGGTSVVFGKPSIRVPLNYTENLLDAMQAASQIRHEGLRQYIVVDDDELTLGQYHAVLSEFEKKRIVYFPSLPLRGGIPIAEAVLRLLPLNPSAGASLHQVRRAMQNRCYVTRRIREETGWAPRVALRDAVQRTISGSGGF
jgi:nucleoside-diphosphate-sugar epimerase